MEKDRVYPPRFVINISSANAQRSGTLVVQFGGSLEAFKTEMILEPEHLSQQEASQNWFNIIVSLVIIKLWHTLPLGPCC